MRIPFSVAMGTAALLLFGAAAAGGEAPAQPDPATATSQNETSSVTETTATEEPDYSYLEPENTSGRVATPEERAGYPAQGPAPAGFEWTLRGPRYSEERCDAESRSWPSSATVCFTLDGDSRGDEGWWFWGMRQAL